MVLSPMMQIAAKLAQQFAPQVINGASNLFSASVNTNTTSHFKCPRCSQIGDYGDITHIKQLKCDCGFIFPCSSGGTRCSCEKLLFPASQTQETIGCPGCARVWKTKSTKDVLGMCRCKNLFDVLPHERERVTGCCQTPLGQLSIVPYKAQEPRIASEAERNR